MQAALAALEAASRAKEADMAALQDGGSRVGALKQVMNALRWNECPTGGLPGALQRAIGEQTTGSTSCML
jgi:hypothetical protein